MPYRKKRTAYLGLGYQLSANLHYDFDSLSSVSLRVDPQQLKWCYLEALKSNAISSSKDNCIRWDFCFRFHDFFVECQVNMISVDKYRFLFLLSFKWLYEDNLLRCPMRGNNMITPARATVMADLEKVRQTFFYWFFQGREIHFQIVTRQSTPAHVS